MLKLVKKTQTPLPMSEMEDEIVRQTRALMRKVGLAGGTIVMAFVFDGEDALANIHVQMAGDKETVPQLAALLAEAAFADEDDGRVDEYPELAEHAEVGYVN